jgi:nitroreductase
MKNTEHPLDTSSFASAFRQMLHSRRSVRKFDGTPVPEHVMQECLDWALLAPNSSNLQPWEFLWVRNPETKKQLAEICFSQSAATTAAELVVCVAHTGLWPQVQKSLLKHYEALSPTPPKAAIHYYKTLVPYVYSVGPFGLFGKLKTVVSFITGFFRPVPREPFSHAALTTWATKTCALACENFVMGLTAHGFDSCVMEGYDSCRLKKLLKITRGATPVMVIACGKQAPDGIYGPRLRMPREQFVREI